MKLELITLSGPKFQEDAYEVILPTAEGDIAVYPGHMPLVSLAVPGIITVRRHKADTDDRLEQFALSGGVIEIASDSVRVLVDEADAGDEIVEAEAKAALDHARALKAEAKDQIELNHAQELIDRQAVRLRLAEIRRHRRVR